ncbi:MAG: hypothetical protein IPH75_15280 [bacterium]|nr:hypothetical protein [bacterium]
MFCRIVSVVLLWSVLWPISLYAQAEDSSNTNPTKVHDRSEVIFEIKLGLTGSGDFSSESERTVYFGTPGSDVTTKSGLNGGLSLEFPTTHSTCFALILDFHRMSPEDLKEYKNLIEVGLQLKSAVRDPNQKLAVRFFGGVSYGAVPQIGGVRAANCLILKGGLELCTFPSPRGIGFVADFGMMGSVIGRSEGDTFSMSPRPFVRAGIAFR